MKARTAPAFSVASKYERVPSLLLAYLWNVDRPRALEALFMTYTEAFAIAQTMGWTTTASWKAGLYRMAPGRWRATVLEPVRTYVHIALWRVR